MAKDTKIEWTDHTFNPWIGCTKVSPGCEHCYAEGESKRRRWAQWGKGKPRHKTKNWDAPVKWNRKAQRSGKRQRVFCASLADVFDSEIDPQWRVELWELISRTPFLDWLLLTKRPENILNMLPVNWGEGWPNVCLMTSVEDQDRTNRISLLLNAPAACYGLSMEPLLGPVSIDPALIKKLNWIIVGGESGGRARPMHPDWVRSVRQQCDSAGVMFFFKQWGCWSPDEKFLTKSAANVACFESGGGKPRMLVTLPIRERRALINFPEEKLIMFKGDKKKTGHFLDGQIHREQPFGKPIEMLNLIHLKPGKNDFSVQVEKGFTKEEEEILASEEKIIEKGLNTFLEVAMALSTINNCQLFRNYGTFKDYCRKRWDFGPSYSQRLLDAAKVIEILPMGKISSPTNERQIRPLTLLEKQEDIINAWEKAVIQAGGKPVTGKIVESTVKKLIKDEAAERKTSERKKTNKVKQQASLNSIQENLDAILRLTNETEIKERIAELVKNIKNLL